MLRKYSALILLFFFSVISSQAQLYTNGQAARAVYGQINFTTGSTVPSQQVLGGVSGLAYYNGQLFVADANRVAATPEDHRIMVFNTNQMPGLRDNILTEESANTDCYLCGFLASFSLGQSTFTSVDSSGNQTSFSPGRTAQMMNNPTAVATDGHYFAVADTDNNRIMLWNEIPTVMDQSADLVLGQTSLTSFQSPQPVNANSLRGPQGVWIKNGKLFVADTQNYRVLIWNSIPTQNNQPADLVLGQVDFTHATAPAPSANNPPAAANTLLNPVSVTTDGTRLFVADLGFNRVLIWNSIPTHIDQNADVVIGQPDMVSSAPNNSVVCGSLSTGVTGQCQSSLNYPRYALSDGTHLYIADGGNDRVLVFYSIPTSNGALADRVLGEPDFVQDVPSSAAISIASTAVDNTGAVDLLPTPMSLALDEKNNLYVSDPYDRRVVVFTPGDTLLPQNSVVNWASEIIRQEGLVVFTGTIVANDTASITVQSSTYTYTIKKTDTLDSIAQALVALVNATDTNVTARFAGVGTGTVYLSSIGTSLGYDTITLSATTSNSSDVVATASGSYLSSGTAGTGAMGMLVEINGTNLSDNSASAALDGTTVLPSTLAGAQVYMDGVATPLLKVTPSQIVTQVPYFFEDRNSTSIYVRTVHSNGSVTVTNPVPLYIAQANPGIFNAPSYPGQPRPWPITQAYHQPGNPTAVVSVDGSVNAGDTATITINGVAYTYTVVAADTLTTIQTNLINLINASDTNVTATAAGSFNRIILTAIQSGAAGNGITVTGASSTNADVTITAYTATTCCVVTPNSLITPANPAGPGELITITGAGLGLVTDPTGTAVNFLQSGVPYAGPALNTAYSFVSGTLGGSTAQVINASIPPQSYGTYSVQLVVPSSATINSITPLYIAQNAFISNTVTLPVGNPVLANPTPVTVPNVSPFTVDVDVPFTGTTVSGAVVAAGWVFDANAVVTGVQILVDGSLYGSANIGVYRPDVCTVYPGEPGCPNVGWNINLQTTLFADGAHTLQVRASGADGLHYTYGVPFMVSNSGSPNATHTYIDNPTPNGIFRGVATFSGWALNDTTNISSVSISVDGVTLGLATYGASRADVCSAFPGRTNCPNVGWTFQYDTNKLSDGTHQFAATALAANGVSSTIANSFVVANFTGQGSTTTAIDSPNVNSGALSGAAVIGGWAIDSNTAVSSVTIAIDGVMYGSANYGIARADVCAIYTTAAGCPNVGFSTTVDTTFLPDGTHTLAVTANLASGQSSTQTTTFVVQNLASKANPVSVYIDTPANGASGSGSIVTSGWALSTGDTVTGVTLKVDGLSFGSAKYGANRSDVCSIFPGNAGCPNVGWSASINSSLLSNGTHLLEATATTTKGFRATSSSQFTVANGNAGPSHSFIDVPGSSSNPFLGTATFSGWAVNDNVSVSSVSVLIDGVPFGTASYNQPRPDVCTVFAGRAGCPNVGWIYAFDTTKLADGSHTFAATQNNSDGTFFSTSVNFTVGNFTTTNPMHIAVDTPLPNITSPIFGTITIAGWVIDDDSAISGVSIAVDGTTIGQANYGVNRQDVCLVYPGHAGCPNVGYSFTYDTTFLANGIHTLAVTGITAIGQTTTFSQQFSTTN